MVCYLGLGTRATFVFVCFVNHEFEEEEGDPFTLGMRVRVQNPHSSKAPLLQPWGTNRSGVASHIRSILAVQEVNEPQRNLTTRQRLNRDAHWTEFAFLFFFFFFFLPP